MAIETVEIDQTCDCAKLRGARVSVSTSLAESEKRWRQATETSTATVFQTYEWLSVWRATIGESEGAQEYLVFIEAQDGELLMAIPLAIQRSNGTAVLQFLGGGMTDYNLPLLNPAFARALSHADIIKLWARILSILPSVDLVWLRRMPQRFDGVPNPLASLPNVGVTGQAFMVSLPEDFSSYKRALDKDFTKNTQYRRRRLDKEGAVELSLPTTPAERSSLVQAIVEWKSAWQRALNLSNTFARPDHLAFYQALSATTFKEGSVEVAGLTVNGVAISGMWSTIFRSRYAVLVMAYDDKWSRFAAGRLLTERVIQSCIERKSLKVFDLTIGGEAYKKDWTNETMEVCDYLRHCSVKGFAFIAVRRAGKAIKDHPVWSRVTRSAAL